MRSRARVSLPLLALTLLLTASARGQQPDAPPMPSASTPAAPAPVARAPAAAPAPAPTSAAPRGTPAPSPSKRPPQVSAPGRAATAAAAPPTDGVPADEPVGRARELLARARLLDEAAANDEKLVADLAKALPALRAAARAARERATRADLATRPDRDAALSRAEELEAEVAVDEVDVAVRRHAAAENRRLARELRSTAVRTVKDPPLADAVATAPCDPPFRITADGRKVYRIECL